MLRIKQIKNYKYAGYPKNEFYINSRKKKKAYMLGLSAITITTFLANCINLSSENQVTSSTTSSSTTTSTIQPPWTYFSYAGTGFYPTISEASARSIIKNVFTLNGIPLAEDFLMNIDTSPTESASVNVDGFNSFSNVGYEYISDYQDTIEFDSKVYQQLSKLVSSNSGGPYIKLIQGYYTYSTDEIENIIQTFINNLKAQGSI